MDRKNHGKRPYAPAWKALEFMSFGNNFQDIRKYEKPLLAMRDFCSLWHELPFSVFQLYQYSKETEELCAHGKVLFDLHLDEAIGNRPLGNLGTGRPCCRNASGHQVLPRCCFG